MYLSIRERDGEADGGVGDAVSALDASSRRQGRCLDHGRASRPVPALGSPVRRTHCGTLGRRDKCVTYYAASWTGRPTRRDGRPPRGRAAVGVY
ncbi:hypothetical protein RGQ21_19740 [Kitasatospora aureofaciens]|nr:hypothetical protein RGQ21_19740 [Kitasatospora aureofaciens]